MVLIVLRKWGLKSAERHPGELDQTSANLNMQASCFWTHLRDLQPYR